MAPTDIFMALVMPLHCGPYPYIPTPYGPSHAYMLWTLHLPTPYGHTLTLWPLPLPSLYANILWTIPEPTLHASTIWPPYLHRMALVIAPCCGSSPYLYHMALHAVDSLYFPVKP